MTGRFIQLSGLVIDLVCAVEHLPEPGQEVETPYLNALPGGGFNAMAAAARMGAAVLYGGTLGTGALADLAIRAIKEENIALVSDLRVPIEQGSCIAITYLNAERSFISYHGAERRVTLDHLNSLPVGDSDILLLTGYSLCKAESAAAFVPWLKSLSEGPRLIFDPGPMIAQIPQSDFSAAMDKAAWLSLNLDEAKQVTHAQSAADAAQLLSAHRQGVIVRTGADGCWLSEQGRKSRHIPAFHVDAVDTNGAGDAHDGAFITALLFGYAPVDAAMIANASAALSTLKVGPATSPDFATIKQFLNDKGIVPSPSAQSSNENTGQQPALLARH